jgi:hypothetical protein
MLCRVKLNHTAQHTDRIPAGYARICLDSGTNGQ